MNPSLTHTGKLNLSGNGDPGSRIPETLDLYQEIGLKRADRQSIEDILSGVSKKYGPGTVGNYSNTSGSAQAYESMKFHYERVYFSGQAMLIITHHNRPGAVLISVEELRGRVGGKGTGDNGVLLSTGEVIEGTAEVI